MSTPTGTPVLRLEIGDPERGGGYVRNKHQADPSPPDEFWRFAEKLPMQPPSLRMTGTTPLWSLRTVAINGHGWYRCFTVQGVGGPFGRAGACQFAFAPAEEVSARKFWQNAVAAVLDDGRLGPITARSQPAPSTEPGEHDRDRIRDVLLGVAADVPLVPMDDGPDGAVRAITGALRVLPDEESTDIVWWTCLLEPQATSGLQHVTGGWPDEFRNTAPDPFRQVERWLQGVAHRPTDDAVTVPRASEALTLLAGRAVTAPPSGPLPYEGCRSLVEILDHISRHELAIRWSDVPELVSDERGVARLRAAPSVFGEYVRHAPREAMALAVEWTLPHELAAELVTALASMHDDGARVGNGAPGNGAGWLSPPPHPEPVGRWHAALGGYLQDLYPDPDALADAVEHLLAAPGAPLHDRTHLAGAGRWLRGLGLTPERRPSLFPVDAGQIAEELTRDGQVGDETTERLSRHSDAHGVLVKVARRLPLADVSLTNSLIRLAHQISPIEVAADRAVALFCRLLDDDMIRRVGRPAWLGDLLWEMRIANAPHEIRMRVGVEGLDRVDGETPDTLLGEYLTLLSEDTDRSPAERRVHGLVARRIQAQTPERSRAPAGSSDRTLAMRIPPAAARQAGGTRRVRSLLGLPGRAPQRGRAATAVSPAAPVGETGRATAAGPPTGWERSTVTASPQRTPPSHAAPDAGSRRPTTAVLGAVIAVVAVIAVAVLAFTLTSTSTEDGGGGGVTTAPLTPAPAVPPTGTAPPGDRNGTQAPTTPPAAGGQAEQPGQSGAPRQTERTSRPATAAPQGPADR